ncbi:MAG: zf-HC2 domain-containing protein [Anaerolineae bacterium]|nr:zf-HC2 domain-containing protein [Anaerolineae bacterium]
MTHQDWQEMIPFYIAQTLSPDETTALEGHLATCVACRREVNEWRQVASAVWFEADDAAQKLPPLSQEVYNRLQYRDRPPATRYSANPPRPRAAQPQSAMPPNRVIRPAGGFRIPLAAAAAVVATLLIGGFILMLNNTRPEPTEVASAPLTQEALTLKAANVTVTPTATVTATVTRDEGLGVIERTPAPATFTPIVTPTPLAQPTAILPATQRPVSTSFPDPTQPTGIGGGGGLGGGAGEDSNTGPSIDGVGDECYLVSSQTINVYEQAMRDSIVVGQMLAGESQRSLVKSQSGWYQVILPPTFIRGWVDPQDVQLIGRCNDLWLPSPTPVSTPTQIAYLPMPQRAEAVVRFVTEGYSRPAYEAPSIATLAAGNRYPVVGLAQLDEIWYLVQVEDSLQLWLSATQVEIDYLLPNTAVPITPLSSDMTPTPMPIEAMD